MAGGPQAQSGHISASFSPESVSVTLTGLRPSDTYWFTLTAVNSAGSVVEEYVLSFKAAGGQSTADISGWSRALAESESAETIREYEAKLLQERNEREASEAANRAVEEAGLRKLLDEEMASEAVAHRVVCSVPSLKGDTLKKVRRVLAKDHCRLGNINRQRHHHGLLVVTTQTRQQGSRLAGGAAIGVTLGSQPAQTSANRLIPIRTRSWFLGGGCAPRIGACRGGATGRRGAALR